jgi:hypothetical protein
MRRVHLENLDVDGGTALELILKKQDIQKVDWIQVAQDMNQRWDPVYMTTKLQAPYKARNRQTS